MQVSVVNGGWDEGLFTFQKVNRRIAPLHSGLPDYYLSAWTTDTAKRTFLDFDESKEVTTIISANMKPFTSQKRDEYEKLKTMKHMVVTFLGPT